MIITNEYIESFMTKKGGYTRESLRKLGVPWPPPKGWKRKLLGKEAPDQHSHELALVQEARKHI